MENKEEVVKVRQILGVALNGNNLVFDDGYTRKVTEEEKSYFANRNPKAVKLSDGSYEIIRFFDYHRHSEYSLLDGCIRVSDMIKKTKYIGAVTDHGNMYCALKWFKGMKKAGKIAVIGEEFYCETLDGDKKGNHLILLAKNNVGYKNLCKLSSMAFKNIYYKPHISYEMLKKYSEGLVCTSACLAGELSQIIMNEDGALSEKEINEKLDKCVEAFKSVFGDDYYIEIQNHHIDKEKIVNPMLVALAKKHNVKVVAATDSHYANKEDHEIHDVVLCISTGKTIEDETRMKFDGDGYHIYSEDEVEERFSAYPEAIDNTLEIAEKCQYVEIETGKHYLPDFPIPDGFKDDTEYLRYIAQKGFTERFEDKFKVLKTDDEETKQKKNEQKHKYWSRWKYEMSVIENMGFSGYFLVVWDFLKFCRDNKIPIGAGRGCVNAGTLIYTDRGLVPIEDIKIGDNVYTHDGTLKPVLKTFKYPTRNGEKLRHIRCFYGDSFGNAYTPNHKIFAIKAEKEIDKAKLMSGVKYTDLINPKPQWIESKNLEVGDLVAFPKVKVQSNCIKKYDLADFANTKCIVTSEKIEESVFGNNRNKMSLHQVSRETGLSRDAIKNFLNGKASVSTEEILNEWADKNECSIKNIGPQTNIKKCSRYLYLNKKTLYFLGFMTGNGWVRSKNNEVGVAFNSKSIKKEMIDYIKDTYGFVFLEQESNKQIGATTFVCYSSILRKFFLEFWKGYNFSAQTKSFPKEIFGLTDELKMAFINGLWDSDGSHKGKSKFCSTSFKLISDLKLLLSSLNIPNGMYFRPTHYSENCNGKNAGDSWQISVPHNFKKITRKCGETTTDFVFKRIYEIKEETTDFVYDISVKDNHSYLTSNFIAHNSGAGSLVLYCLHITDFDPIKYDLLFERFLNPDRISLPDIDSDISKRKRDMVIEYVTNKYGQEHVSHIITFGTLAAKNAIKDVARVYNITPSEANAITKTIPSKPGITIGEALGESPEFAGIIKKNQLYEKVVKIAQKIEGLPRQTGVHACGICIGQKTIDEYCPTARVKDDDGEYFITTQFEGPEAEDVGLVKFDFLGLRTLDAEDVTLELIKKNNPDFNMSPDDIPINDIESYLMLKEGNTDGVFQFESDGMTSLVKQMFSDVQPTDNEEKGEEYFERLTAAVALYRPGPMDEIPNYLKAMKSGNIVYDHPKLKSILSSTYGILVYQEEIMMAVRELAGFSKGAADTIRKAMGKKKIEIMNEYSNYFIYGSEKHDKENPDDVKNIPGCIKMGISESTARMIWDKMVKFASYAFNKSHATCYAALGARTAYLACHYPVEYTTGILNSFIGNNDKISYYVAKCNRKGVTVLPPDVNRSGIEFDVVNENEGKKIIFGLSGIKDVGTIAANAIIKERKENGKFLSIEDFLTRLSDEKVNKRVLTALAYTGAFDSFGQGNRAEIVASVPKMVEIIKAIKAENKNQINMFDDLFETKGQRYKLEVPQKADLPMIEKSFKEKDYLGYFVNHPITAYSKKLNSWRSKNFLEDISEVVSAAESSNFPIKRKRIAGLIQDFKIINYKDKRTGNPKIMIVFSLNDETGTVKCVGYDEIAVKYSHLIHDKTIAYILCNAKKDDFGVSCTVEAIHVFSEEEKD